MMGSFVFDFQDPDTSMIHIAGGKGAGLGALSRIEGIHVPDGFCISTDAYKRILGGSSTVKALLHRLSLLKVKDRNQVRALSAEIRKAIEALPIPRDIHEEILQHLYKLGKENAYAIRSSATAEDLPAASFAGQQDSYLNIMGEESVLEHISRCWASLFTERSVIYRMQNGFDHREVQQAVVVQKMVFADTAGIMFTADPVSFNRKIVSIDAGFGLGEALVSGIVNADQYKVQNGRIVEKKISTKKLAIHALKDGGTKEVEMEQQDQDKQVLTDDQIVQLERTGRKVEAHFDCPQDIEWCFCEDRLYLVQSRPVTTLYPIPEANDQENHVYLSVGHQQMMTDAMKPLGLSFFLLTTRALMRTAGGRLFVDVSPILAAPASRKMIIDTLGKHDPLIKDALQTITAREGFIKTVTDDQQNKNNQAAPLPDYEALKDYDPAIVSQLIRNSQAPVEALKQTIFSQSGTKLFDFILEDLEQLKKVQADPQSFGVIMTAMNASAWINEKMNVWLGEKNAADSLTQSVPHNITSEMGLALLDVADVIRPYPEIIAYLQQANNDHFLNELDSFEGGEKVQKAIHEFLNKYGMRCAGEIDITRTRWSEKPSMIVPMILNNIRNFEPGESKRKFDQGLQEALQKEQDLLTRLKDLPDGEQKAREAKRMIDLVRSLIGYREYPKYAIVSRYFLYKQVLLKEAERLLESGIIHETEDIYYLSFEELREVVRTHSLDYQIISKRKEEYMIYETLTPPRVMTSDGEVITGKYKRDILPPGAIVGLPVSAGMIEGRARVILNMEDAELEEGDILVTSFTDPSWTPLFVSIKGLVTEVGGLMTHGAVIAREYGLPAVVGVENATRLIKNGQRIRVHGTEGYVEILDAALD